MKIAILGATSEIAKDLIRSFLFDNTCECILFARRPERVRVWQSQEGFSRHFLAQDISAFDSTQNFDALINFIGVGNPALAADMGASILDVTASYDEKALNYLRNHPTCRYIFLSSGAVYGQNFDEPVTANSLAILPVNNNQINNWYSIAKFYAEMRHRALSDLSIIDLRIFNYISRHQDIDSRFLVTDIIRTIKNRGTFTTSRSNFIRDYLSPSDFYQIIMAVLNEKKTNCAIDCFTKAPIDKYSLLKSMNHEFGLIYKFDINFEKINVTGFKKNYYSTNHIASKFGYTPQKTALEAVIEETGAMLQRLETKQHSTMTGTVN